MITSIVLDYNRTTRFDKFSKLDYKSNGGKVKTVFGDIKLPENTNKSLAFETFVIPRLLDTSFSNLLGLEFVNNSIDQCDVLLYEHNILVRKMSTIMPLTTITLEDSRMLKFKFNFTAQEREEFDNGEVSADIGNFIYYLSSSSIGTYTKVKKLEIKPLAEKTANDLSIVYAYEVTTTLESFPPAGRYYLRADEVNDILNRLYTTDYTLKLLGKSMADENVAFNLQFKGLFDNCEYSTDEKTGSITVTGNRVYPTTVLRGQTGDSETFIFKAH